MEAVLIHAVPGRPPKVPFSGTYDRLRRVIKAIVDEYSAESTCKVEYSEFTPDYAKILWAEDDRVMGEYTIASLNDTITLK